ncbi:PepSY-associated TM helix domain-containing protein [Phenylobacterium sp. LjRoot219]|uniref:PepSY-associated TM helix domain-containing protein n=1 Tax=Phenylobacterium sp. LjRoot219 TaxID=3342283 RepID=UPI003ECEEE29
MRALDLLHRWLGAIIGLLLAVFGLSGALLAHKDLWVTAPGARDAQVQDVAALAAAVEKIMADPAERPRSILFATRSFGLDRLNFGEEAGAYATQGGEIVARWSSKWDRPELWLFDLHHHLLSGDTGETIGGVAALVGLGFVVTGLILWWPLRRSFQLRAWPKSGARFAILRHHRDWGALLAPVLALVLASGALMIFRPLTNVVFGPGAAAEITSALKPPRAPKAELAAHPDWRGMLETARRLYPDAEVRSLSLPKGEAGLISLRLRQPHEWAPNGRTMLWFAADSGRLVEARGVQALPASAQAYGALYPLHAGKVGGLAYRLLITLVGVGLTLFGTLTVWTFWFRRKPLKRSVRVAQAPVRG